MDHTGRRRGVRACRDAVTLQDVARAAEVAVSTASRALSNPDRVSARTRERVQTVARRLGYRPPVARALPAARGTPAARAVRERHHQPAQLRPDPRRGGPGPGGRLHADHRRDAREPRARADHAERLDPAVDGFVLAASRLDDDEPAGDRAAPTRSRCTTARSTASRAWSPSRRTAAGRWSSTWSPSATGPWRSSPDRTTPGRSAQRWRGLSAARRGGRASRSCGSGRSCRRADQGPAAADVGTGRRRRPHGSPSTTCSRSGCCSGCATAAWTCRARSAWSATTTSSAPTSATRR